MSVRLFLMLLLLVLSAEMLYAQEEVEQQLEDIAEKQESEEEDDNILQQLESFRQHPLNLNAADEDDLRSLALLSAPQIEYFIQYRKLFGEFKNIYELQAIPSWTVAIIEKIIPYVTVADDNNILLHLRDRLKGGTNTWLVRYAQVLQKAKGYKDKSDSSSHYIGNGMKLFTRYRYSYKNLLQWGVLGDKDAGETLFKEKQRYGFDFYSFHFFVKKVGVIKQLALGDYTVSMGQGLIQWQGMAMGKGSDIMNIKRESPTLKAYNSPGEFNFNRGVGITLAKNRWEGTAFFSLRKLDASTDVNEAGEKVVTSLISSGYHRTSTEMNKKGNLKQMGIGGVIKYTTAWWHVAINMVRYKFSEEIEKKDEPYNLFAIKGNAFINSSVDYSYTYRNMHFFGEAAIDNNVKKALLNGVLISLDQRVNLSLIHRYADRAYQALYANSFTENTLPGNESGIYTGINLSISKSLSFAGYSDIFKFPWLKYRVDAPSFGKEYMVQLIYKPTKQTELYSRYRYKGKQINNVDDNPQFSPSFSSVQLVPQQNWRFNSTIQLSKSLTLRNRCEMIWYDYKKTGSEQGFVWTIDVLYKPISGKWSGNFRLSCFDTDGYNSRLYTYENDVLYSYAIPLIYNKGNKYYFNWHRKFSFKWKSTLDLYFRWSHVIYKNISSISSGLDEIDRNQRSEIKVQSIFSF